MDDWDWDTILGNAVGTVAKQAPAIVTSLYAAQQARAANERAAQIAAQAAGVATTAVTNGNQTAINAVQAGKDAAVGTLAPVAAAAVPARAYMQNVVAADPYTLTPQQQVELADRGRTVNASIGKNPYLAGGGRSVAAMYDDTINRGRAGMIDANIKRGDAAATNLNASGNAATTNTANIQSGAGSTTAQLQAGQGTAVGNIVQNAGDTSANAETATGQANANVMGNLASFFAQERKTRYAPVSP